MKIEKPCVKFGGFFKTKGAYALLIKVDRDRDIVIGALGNVSFKKGFYVYVGSAMGGLNHRLKRHLSKNKKLRWHIDYLLQKAEVVGVMVWESNKRIEDKIAKKLIKRFKFVKGFGSSDSKLKSHLFFCKDREKLIETLFKALRRSSVFVEF
ncbi:GIY-YIG nuclease family protein [Hippea alviniae]|uniref:GIY-YIG nuclease family protein n=1 Tax=Hippea alviniae TaxID=1279027 RepID=UPI0003B489BE|nr:GIY-YIG nuclease family protein [Hippea alviniae]